MVRRLLLIAGIIAFEYTVVMSQTFTTFINRLNGTDASQRSALVDSFMSAQTAKGFPVVEDSIASFVYRGTVASKIVVTGDHTGWSAAGEPMGNIPGTNFYYLTKQFEPDARLDYKFIVDGNWILDPLNAHTVSGGFGPNSELAMGRYVQPKEIIYTSGILHGTVTSFPFASTAMNNTRTVSVYLPPGYDAGTKIYPVLYVHDGPDYLNLGSMANVLDNLIYTKKIDPIICVFVPPTDRTNEYRLSKIVSFTTFITHELVPFIDSSYRTIPIPSYRGTLGSSDGGHISLYLAISYYQIFGLSAGQSTTIVSDVLSPIVNGPKLPIKFYGDCGTYDIAGFIDANRSFWSALRLKSYDLKSAEYHEGHSWGNWRAHLDDILTYFYPSGSTSAESGKQKSFPAKFSLSQNYPNPFNPITRIKYTLPESGFVTLKVYDALGVVVAVLVEEMKPAGSYELTFNASFLSSGIYFYKIQALHFTRTRQMVVLK